MNSRSRRVLRGGSFNNKPGNMRCANRDRNQPGNPNANNGFRLCLGVVAPQESTSRKHRAQSGPRCQSIFIPAFTSCSRPVTGRRRGILPGPVAAAKAPASISRMI
jgi:hypothetical protein